MAKKELILHADMGQAILKRLSEFAPLPNAGIVAGQAVASAISELFHDGRAVAYNDIDVFREQTKAEYDSAIHRIMDGELKTRPRGLQTCDFSVAHFVNEYRFIGMVNSSRYRVLTTRRVDLLNEVQCRFENTDPLHFLDTFDMNCVQAGVNLETGKLIWTPKFASFCRNRQIEITKLHTPAHSLIRYLKKRQELEGTFGNDEAMFAMVAAACEHSNPDEQYSRVFNMGFGSVYRDKLKAFESVVLQHFDIHETTQSDAAIFYLKSRSQVDKRLLVKRDVDMVHLLPVKTKALFEKHVPGKAMRLQYLSDEADAESLTQATWTRFGDSYVQGNVTPAQMKKMDKIVKEHYIAAWLIAPTLAEQWSKYQFIRQQVRERGLWVYGVLENNRFAQDTSSEFLSSFLEEQEKLLSIQLKEKDLPDMVLDGFHMRELVFGRELVEEGSDLHHCVGGYAESVKDGKSRIISARPVGSDHARQWLTIELGKDAANNWGLAQVKGVVNRSPNKTEYKAACKYLYLTLMKEALPSFIGKPVVRYMPNMSARIGKFMYGMRENKQHWITLGYWSDRLAHKLALPHSMFDADTGGRYHRRHVLNYWLMVYKTREARRLERQNGVVPPVTKRSIFNPRHEDIPF